MRGHIDQMPPPPLKDELRILPPVKIKVHFYEDVFVIQVPRTTKYSELIDKVRKGSSCPVPGEMTAPSASSTRTRTVT